ARGASSRAAYSAGLRVSAFFISRPRLTAAVALFAVAVLADAFHRHHFLVLVGAEDAHALHVASGDADIIDRTADQLAAIGDQHDLVAVLDRERGNQPAVALVDDHGGDAFAAATRDAVFVRRGAPAQTAPRHPQHEPFPRPPLHLPLPPP